MPSSDPAPIRSESVLVDYAKSLDCIHCGLCLATCPTYVLTGVETSSPRGRIHLMRAVAEERLVPDAAYADELDFCLLCRHCESVCPAGVRFGAMMEFARGRVDRARPRGPLARLARWLGFRVLLPSRLLLRLAGSALRFAQVTGLAGLAARLGPRAAAARDLPAVPPLRARRLPPARVPAAAEDAEVAGVLLGCAMPELLAGTTRATLASLSALGLELRVPPAVVCCGSLHAHNGDPEGARALARRMIEAFDAERDAAGRPVPVVVNSAGCGAHMKECHHLFAEDDPWHARARAFAGRVVDYAEHVLPRLDPARLGRIDGAFPQPVTWDDPCHLCHGQGIRAEPRAVLDALPGLRRVDLAGSESCCGSAGIYSLLRPADSVAVLAPKLEALERTGARTLVTANPGCQLQWSAGLRRAGSGVRVAHLAELVAHALASAPRP